MEYILVIVFQLIGIGLHVMQKIVALGNKYPEKSRKEIIDVFQKEDWDSVGISILILVLHVVSHYAIDTYAHTFRAGISYYELWCFGIALVGGYAGQRLIYNYLGTAEKFLNKKVEDKLQ